LNDRQSFALARKLAVMAWAMMRDASQWDPHRVLPDSEAEQATIKVTQQPNLPVGEVRHLPKRLREQPEEISIGEPWSPDKAPKRTKRVLS
jgi:hypothetical protein